MTVPSSYCYFADYEVLTGDRFKIWGHTTLTYRVDSPEQFDPATVVARVQQQAAEAHQVDRSEIRIRSLSRLL